MEIDKIEYKNFDITVSYNKDDKSFHAYSLCGNSFDEYDGKRQNQSLLGKRGYQESNRGHGTAEKGGFPGPKFGTEL